MLNIYINTWGNYNENGADGGEWITLPMESSELDDILARAAERMGDNDPEWFVNDYEWTTDEHLTDISENSNYYELNELVQRLDELDEYEQPALFAILDAITNDIEQALEYIESGNYQFYEDMDLTDVAEELVNEFCFTEDTPGIFTIYFDYQAFGRDLHFDGYYETKYGVIYIG